MCPVQCAVVLPAVSGLAFRPPCVSARPLNPNATVMLEEVRYRRTTAGDEKLVSALVSWAVREESGQREISGHSVLQLFSCLEHKKAARVDAI